MKIKLIFAVLLSALALSCGSHKKTSTTDLAPYLGVWASADCELVQTEKYTLLFARENGKVSAILRRNVREGDAIFSDFFAGFVFDTQTAAYEKITPTPDRMKIPFDDFLALADDGRLTVRQNEKTLILTQIEKLESCAPYEMPHADLMNVGACLQNWQLGVFEYDTNPAHPHIEIGTNEHTYIFVMTPRMLYCRAARIRHNDRGSLFAQNIRLMINDNTGEKTAEMAADNLKVGSKELTIDNSLFRPDVCAFEEDGIYWSLISCTPDRIEINGCGEVYTIDRPAIDDPTLTEWFVFKRY